MKPILLLLAIAGTIVMCSGTWGIAMGMHNLDNGHNLNLINEHFDVDWVENGADIFGNNIIYEGKELVNRGISGIRNGVIILTFGGIAFGVSIGLLGGLIK